MRNFDREEFFAEIFEKLNEINDIFVDWDLPDFLDEELEENYEFDDENYLRIYEAFKDISEKIRKNLD